MRRVSQGEPAPVASLAGLFNRPSHGNSIAIALALTLLAAGLRFNSLDAGLKHEPHSDERVFVEEAEAMIARGDWSPRYFEYPGLLLWMFKALFLITEPAGADAYLVARSFIAACSSAAVFVVTMLGCRWFSLLSGVLSGMLLALSPVCVHTAHSIRPDAVIHGLLIAALAAGAPLRGDSRPALAWILGGVAVAVKFSAALVFPALLLAALLDRLPLRKIAWLCLLALGAFTLLSPGTFLGRGQSVVGLSSQIGYHYANQVGMVLPSLVQHLTHTLPLALSWPGIGLVGVGVATFLRHRRGAVWVAFIGVWVLVFSSTDVSFIRFMVPVTGALSLLAGAGFIAMMERSSWAPRLAFTVWAVAALSISGFEVSQYLQGIGRPSTRDRALAWIEAQPGLQHVASMEDGLGRFTPHTADIVHVDAGAVDNELLVSHLDALILTAGTKAPSGFQEAARFSPASPAEGRELVAYAHPAPPRFTAQALDRAFLRTSSPDRDHKLLESSLRTRWRADTSPAFIEVTLPEAADLGRVELLYGSVSRGKDQVSRVLVDGSRVPFARVRGPVNRQRRDRGRSELLAFPAARARTIRLELEGDPPFIASHLRVYTKAP